MKNSETKTTAGAMRAVRAILEYPDETPEPSEMAASIDRETQVNDLLRALGRAAYQLEFTAASIAKGRTISLESLQNCAAAARSALAKANG